MEKVYVFGNKTFGGLIPQDTDDFEFVFNNFPHDKLKDLEKLTEFPIIIVDYDAFYDGGHTRQEHLDLFAKHLVRALKNGSYVVFVHYDERTPRKPASVYDESVNDMVPADFLTLDKEQIGFKFLTYSGSQMRPINIAEPEHHGVTKLHYFDKFLDTWGSTKLIFKAYEDKNLIPIQVNRRGEFMSFACKCGKGKLIYISCQRNTEDADNIENLISTLAKNVSSYKAHSYIEIPEWATDPLFKGEKEIVNEIDDLNKKIEGFEKSLKPYTAAKELAFKSDDDFKEGLVEFLVEQFGLKITSVEKYKEDFIVHEDKKGVTLAVGEAKAINGGVTKGAVYQLYNNREEQGYDDATSGLLIVNQHLTANSWKERDKNVDSKAYKAASNENILIVRLIDLLRLWNLVQSSGLTRDQAIQYLTSNRGWLKVADNGEITVVT